MNPERCRKNSFDRVLLFINDGVLFALTVLQIKIWQLYGSHHPLRVATLSGFGVSLIILSGIDDHPGSSYCGQVMTARVVVDVVAVVVVDVRGPDVGAAVVRASRLLQGRQHGAIAVHTLQDQIGKIEARNTQPLAIFYPSGPIQIFIFGDLERLRLEETVSQQLLTGPPLVRILVQAFLQVRKVLTNPRHGIHQYQPS